MNLRSAAELPEAVFGRVLDLATRAGAAILEIYRGPIAVETKADLSPVTEADRTSHRIIAVGLAEFTPELPVLSEEGRDTPFDERRSWGRFWLVDPLDGTKEFIQRNGEFTVNIALVEGGRPVWGVVYVPAQDTLFWGGAGRGAWVRRDAAPPEPLRVRPAPADGLTVVQSRSHPSPELDAYLEAFRVAGALSVGSSLKFCALAEGRADLYPRLGPTMEWDTAAGQAVLEGAGGRVTDLDGRPLAYNKPSLLNPHFVASA